MTEESYQQARKVMQSANFIRGMITAAKGEVARWTAIEDSHRRNLKEAQAEGAKKMLHKALLKLAAQREKFAKLQFPDPNIKKEYKPTLCKTCGIAVAQGMDECLDCEQRAGHNYLVTK